MSIEWPVKEVKVTGEFGNSPDYYAQFGQRGHNGIDIGVWTGTDVFACDDGVVEFEGWGQNHNWMGVIAGISIILRHWWGFSGYAHLSETIVDKGQTVKRSQKIAKSGATGVGTGPHLHFETFPQNPNFANGYAGRINPRTLGLVPHGSGGGSGETSATQRVVGKNPVKRRADASSKAAEKQPPLAPGETGNFDGWKRGEKVNDGIVNTDIWFRGISGDWFWSGGFTSQATSGLKDLNPVDKTLRTVGDLPVRVRKEANTTSAVVQELKAGTKVKVLNWLIGEQVSGMNQWYKLADGYAWSGAFTSQSKDGLTQYKEPAKPVDPKPVDPKPVDPKPPVKDVGPGPVLGQVEGWDSVFAPDFDKVFKRPTPAGVEYPLHPEVTVEDHPASKNGYNTGREGAPNHFVVHHAVTTSAAGALATLSGTKGAPTTQYVIHEDVSYRMVSDQDTAATNTRWKSNTFGINAELINQGTNTGKPSAQTHLTTARVFARDALKWKMRLPIEVGVNLFGHKDVSKYGTECPGLVDLQLIARLTNEEIARLQKKPEEPKPEPEDTELKGLIKQLIDLLKKIFRVN